MKRIIKCPVCEVDMPCVEFTETINGSYYNDYEPPSNNVSLLMKCKYCGGEFKLSVKRTKLDIFYNPNGALDGFLEIVDDSVASYVKQYKLINIK